MNSIWEIYKRIMGMDHFIELSKSNVLCLLFMMHVDHYFPSRCSKLGFDLNRIRKNQCFDEWILCACLDLRGQQCLNRWNFANGSHGLCKRLEKAECEAWKWYCTDRKKPYPGWETNRKKWLHSKDLIPSKIGET